MTLDQFSAQFDVLVDSYRRFKDFDRKDSIDSLDFNEFEKSSFLTDAQEDLVRDYYMGKTKESFEETEETRRALAELVIQKEITVSEASSPKLTKNSYIFDLPKNLWYIIYEGAILSLDGSDACEDALNGIGEGTVVVPTRHDELHSILNNPFRGPKVCH